jgi:hypothetical protein
MISAMQAVIPTPCALQRVDQLIWIHERMNISCKHENHKQQSHVISKRMFCMADIQLQKGLILPT